MVDFSICQGMVNGLKIGAVYGTLVGLMFWIVGAVIGIVVGAVLGIVSGIFHGLLCGLATALVSRLGFYPVRHRAIYRCCVTIVNMLIPLCWLPISGVWGPNPETGDPGLTLMFLYGPVLTLCGYAFFHAGKLVDWYTSRPGVLAKAQPFTNDAELYDPGFQQGMFGALAQHYERASSITSLGLANRWRAKLVERMDLVPGMVVCDLMSGGGELWPYLLRQIGPDGQLTAVDYSPAMLAQAQQRLEQLPRQATVVLHEADALASGLPAESFDAVVCAYGLKTLSPAQLDTLVQEVHRILRPNGIFGFVELSHPANPWLRRAMNAYLARVVPLLSKLLGADRRPYRLLGEYIRRFESCDWLLPPLRMRGFILYRYHFLGGCATAVVGMKQAAY
ncbi:MAG: hypothetical protein OHK0022_12170 [Roseiflexaceae bacterium]